MVDVGGVDEVDAAVMGSPEDPLGLCRVGGAAEHHGAEPQDGDAQPGATEEVLPHHRSGRPCARLIGRPPRGRLPIFSQRPDWADS